MQREIKVIANSLNKNEVYLSNAETVGELKAELINKGYDLQDMDMKEGKSRTILSEDMQILPTNFLYKGVETNDLVVMITPQNTKIKSGMMTRTELYNKIKAYGLQEACKQQFGKNFTQCSTQILSDLTANYEMQHTIQTSTTENSKYSLDSVVYGINKIINALQNFRIGGIRVFPEILCENLRQSLCKDYQPYTEEELEEMARL